MSKEELKTLKDIRCPLIAEAKENRFVETEKLEDMQKYLDETWVAKAEIKKEVIKWIKYLELIHSEDSPKPLMIPTSNREYWLFTEYRQFLMDRFNITIKELRS